MFAPSFSAGPNQHNTQSKAMRNMTFEYLGVTRKITMTFTCKIIGGVGNNSSTRC